MQHTLAKMKSVLQSSSNAIRGFSLSCPAYGQDAGCGNSTCSTCELCHLVQSFSALVHWDGHTDGFARKWDLV